MISIVSHTSVTDHRLHVIALIMIGVSAVALLFTLADRKIRTQPQAVPQSYGDAATSLKTSTSSFETPKEKC